MRETQGPILTWWHPCFLPEKLMEWLLWQARVIASQILHPLDKEEAGEDLEHPSAVTHFSARCVAPGPHTPTCVPATLEGGALSHQPNTGASGGWGLKPGATRV